MKAVSIHEFGGPEVYATKMFPTPTPAKIKYSFG